MGAAVQCAGLGTCVYFMFNEAAPPIRLGFQRGQGVSVAERCPVACAGSQDESVDPREHCLKVAPTKQSADVATTIGPDMTQITGTKSSIGGVLADDLR